MIETKYLMVGNSAGGIGAAEAVREVDSRGKVTIVSDEPYPAYSRPLISKYLAGGASLDSILYRSADFYAANRIEAKLGVRVNSLSLAKHRAELNSGESVCWERLLLATGGTPIVPKMRGLRRRGVSRFTTLDDAKRLRQLVEGVQSVVVIGGGLIGISATEALVKLGLKVTVVEMKEHVLNVMLDEIGSGMVEVALRKAGVEVVARHTVAQITGRPGVDERVGGVTLDNGDRVSCDAVVMAIGVTPRLDLVTGSGLGANRGILVDRFMATNVPDVFACGDVAESYDFVYGSNRVVPVWPMAYIGGRVAGYNMAGRGTEFGGGTAMNSLNYFGVPIISAGMVTAPADHGYEELTGNNRTGYRKVILKDNRIAGMVLVGDIDRAGVLFGLMKDDVDVSSFKALLTVDGFSLVSLPPQLRAERRSLSSWNLFAPVAG